ncbi:hypothetical protein B0H16DRAFT_1726921 [Mycena metata]|uniref:Uncharacterized protein n=1 Tax=Mycena metata TaxID=1033252 RepID=A0AAD7IKL4_9AGAR|nr:hypothetical protein B0H16DRAFT_1726921 [Mycena metata]
MQVPNSKDPPVSRLLALVALVDWSTLPQSVRDERHNGAVTSTPSSRALAATGVTILQPERRESKQDGEDVLRDGEGSLGDLKEVHNDSGKLASKSENDVLSEDGQVETGGHYDAPIVTLKWSEQEAVAAGRIQHAVLRARHRVENEQSELSTQLSQFFEECHGKSATTEMDRLYRVHFLGPLPHLLLCLQMAYKQAQGEKAEASKEIATAQGEALERADMNYKEMQRILKAVNRVQKMLRPSARESIHMQGDVNKLKGVAGEAILLLGNLPFDLAPAVQEHLKIASKAFLDVERDQA